MRQTFLCGSIIISVFQIYGNNSNLYISLPIYIKVSIGDKNFSNLGCISSGPILLLTSNSEVNSFMYLVFIISLPIIFPVGGARGVMVIVVGNGYGGTSSNPGRD